MHSTHVVYSLYIYWLLGQILEFYEWDISIYSFMILTMKPSTIAYHFHNSIFLDVSSSLYLCPLIAGLFFVCRLHQRKTFLYLIFTTFLFSLTICLFFLVWQFDNVGSHGTKVIIYNLWLNSDAKLELDFDSDAEVNIFYLSCL